MNLRQIFYALPPAWRFAARRAWFFPSDFLKKLSQKTPDLAPPKGMIFTGSGDFVADGRRLLADFQRVANLQPQHRVLDVGSGIGRIALPLADFLNEKGTYDGFDVVERGVFWCRENISSRHPNFRFLHVPLKNDLYTSDGSDASDFTFPYADESFDFCCVISVFTHLLPDEVARFLSEIRRCLRPGGTVFATFFWYDSPDRLAANSAFTFPHRFENHALMDKKVQAGNVAFSENWLAEQCAGFDVLVKNFGFWDGRERGECLNFQDVLVLQRV